VQNSDLDEVTSVMFDHRVTPDFHRTKPEKSREFSRYTSRQKLRHQQHKHNKNQLVILAKKSELFENAQPKNNKVTG
jgi:hypothetical protein